MGGAGRDPFVVNVFSDAIVDVSGDRVVRGPVLIRRSVVRVAGRSLFRVSVMPEKFRATFNGQLFGARFVFFTLISKIYVQFYLSDQQII